MYSRLAGYVFQRVQITTGTNYDQKKRYSRVVWPAIFSGGFKLQPEKNMTGKIKGTVIWLMEVAQIWQERYDLKKRNVQSSGRLCFSVGSNYNRKKIRQEKKVQSSGRQLETGKNYVRKKKGTVVWSLVGGQNTKHNTHHRHNNQQDEPCHRLKFGGNVTTGKKSTVVWPAMFVSGF
jgi:hypothetical protein